ncbi:MAG: hypothetical protein WBV74_13090 [Pseudonocardiaceae bacterium]
MTRDRLVIQDARRLGIPVINVDGTRGNTIANIVANYFRRYLPAPQEH